VDPLLDSKGKLGADAGVAAGPKGRDAQAGVDGDKAAEILSYSRSLGLFSGLSLEGSTIRPDAEANKELYGRSVSLRDIVLDGKVAPPASARQLLSTLERKSPGPGETPGSEGGTQGRKPDTPGSEEGGTKGKKPSPSPPGAQGKP
jgi:hypothetical protein